MSGRKYDLGNSVAPWRFVLFALVLLAAGVTLSHFLGAMRGIMGGFDVAAATFLIACAPLFNDLPNEIREVAKRNDANRGGMLLLTTAVAIVILVSVGSELSHKGKPQPAELVLVVVTLCLCWTFSNLVYALHYAHLYYTRNAAGKDAGGLKFPDTDEPNYWDFAYYASCLGMTFQTSDVDINSAIMRRITMFHCLGAFVFNLGIIAFTINILGSS